MSKADLKSYETALHKLRARLSGNLSHLASEALREAPARAAGGRLRAVRGVPAAHPQGPPADPALYPSLRRVCSEAPTGFMNGHAGTILPLSAVGPGPGRPGPGPGQQVRRLLLAARQRPRR